MLRLAGNFLISWASLFGLWFLFVDSRAPGEVFVGLAASMLAAFVSVAVDLLRPARFKPKLRWLLEIRRVPALMIYDCGLLAKHVFTRIFLADTSPGMFQLARFDAGGDDSRSAARRVLAITYSTLPPNSIIVDIDRSAGVMLFHQLEEHGIPEPADRLGAR